MFLSKFRFFSIGIVAVDKAKESSEIVAIPIEMLPEITGEIADMLTTTELSGVRADDSEYTIKLKASKTIRKIQWLPIGNGNVITPPDVVLGEKVMIFQFGDTDRYFWTTMGNTHGLRRLETTVWGWAASNDPTADLDPDTNMYTLEISTDTKKILLRTTQANEEPFAYELSLDTEAGFFTVTDNEENSISLNSAERIIKAINSDGSHITIDKETILAYCKKLMDITCDGDVIGKVTKTVDLTVGESYTARAPKMQFGEDDAVQPSTLGDNQAAAMADLIAQINASQVIGNLGAPTSAIQAVKPIIQAALIAGGDVYSKVNTNQ